MTKNELLNELNDITEMTDKEIELNANFIRIMVTQAIMLVKSPHPRSNISSTMCHESETCRYYNTDMCDDCTRNHNKLPNPDRYKRKYVKR